MLRMMVRPRWVLMLLLALAIAAGFALLGQWQLGRAVQSGHVEKLPTETVMPLADAAAPSAPIRQTSTGQMVEADGRWVPGDEQLVSGRLNGGSTGWWVVGHLEVDGMDAGIPVARGWAPTAKEAASAARSLAAEPASDTSVTGRLLPTEAPEQPAEGADPHAMTTVAVAALVNLWTQYDEHDVYEAYIVDHGAVSGLDRIDSPPPSQEVELNWLNVFYAIEWTVFAGFAIFLWYRLVRDAYRREQEELEDADEAREQAGASSAAP